MRLTTALIIVFALTPLHAADDVWNNLARLKPGDQIQVVRKDMASVESQFVSFSDSSITLRSGNSDSVVEKDRVVRVSTKPQGQRKHNAKMGALVGGGIGALCAVALAKTAGASVAVFGIFFYTVIGTGIGAAIPPGSTIYRVKQIR